MDCREKGCPLHVILSRINDLLSSVFEKRLENKIENYKEQKENLMNELRELISEGIKEYKEGKIKFRF